MSVPALMSVAVLLVVLSPVWLPLSALADLVRGRFRLPTARLMAFGTGWAWMESIGILRAGGLWLTRRAGDETAHYRLMTWWAASLMRVLRATTGIRIEVAGVEAIQPGRAVVLCRHASLADSLVSAWVVTTVGAKQPRYVLKTELQSDPCLDIVGNRLPHHFLDRTADDVAGELEALRRLTAYKGGLGADEVGVIFAEGTRASPGKRQRALAKIGERDPVRAERLGALRHLLPPRPAGSRALLQGDPGADVVLAWHVGFEGLSDFAGILRHLARRPPVVRFAMKRVPRGEVPVDDEAAFQDWLDGVWLRMDADVDAMLGPPS